MANNVFSGWYKASIYDPATGTVVQLNKLSIENTSWEDEILTAENTQSLVYGGERKALTLAFFDDEGIAQLQSWSEAGTPVRAVAAGPTSLQWYESVPMQFRKIPRANKRDGLNLFEVSMEFIGVNPAIYTNQNLIAYKGWQDSNGDGIADGYFTNSTTNSFINDIQTIETNANTEFNLSFLEFPISDIKIAFSNYALTSLYPNRGRMSIIQRDRNITLLSETSTLFTDSIDKIYNIEIITNNNIFYLDIRPIRSAASLGNVSIKFPAITINGKLTSADQFMDW